LGLPTASAFMLARSTYAFLVSSAVTSDLEHSNVVLGHLVADALVSAGVRIGAAMGKRKGQYAVLILTVS
jgi:hypothetical protein